jgi:hypothetical protein
MAMSCGQVGRLSVASAGGHATEAERLELEAHFATCARCAAEHAIVLGATRVLRSAEPGALSSAARERVRRAALARRAHAPVTARRFGWPLAGGAVLAMAAAVAIWIGVRKPAELSVIGGDVTVAAAPAASGQEPGGGAVQAVQAVIVRSGRGGEVKLADASTALAPATEIVWRHERRVVELREGSLTVDVAHRPGQHFEVHTPRFVVEVVGTRFSVDLTGVRTERGTVRVLSLDRKLIGTLEGGHSWTLPTPQAQTTPPAPAEAPEPPAAPPAIAAAPAPGSSQSPSEDSSVIRLGRARRALARGNAGEARRIVKPLFGLGRDVAAEARAIHAESYLSEGRYADAVAGYRVVSRDFPHTPQAESALYAVGQLESEHGRPVEARASLEDYLARYPHGRFAKEAAGRLARLSPPQPR